MIIIYTHIPVHAHIQKLTITTLAKCAETRAYTPPDDPTTGAVISVTDTARDPVVMIKELAFGKQTNEGIFVLCASRKSTKIPRKGNAIEVFSFYH